MSEILTLHLKKKFYEAIKSGEKNIEYRDMTEYWRKRITPDKKIIHFFLGYPPRGTPPLVKRIKRIVFNVATQQIEIHLENDGWKSNPKLTMVIDKGNLWDFGILKRIRRFFKGRQQMTSVDHTKKEKVHLED